MSSKNSNYDLELRQWGREKNMAGKNCSPKQEKKKFTRNTVCEGGKFVIASSNFFSHAVFS